MGKIRILEAVTGAAYERALQKVFISAIYLTAEWYQRVPKLGDLPALPTSPYGSQP
jgi:hypothetical protein